MDHAALLRYAIPEISQTYGKRDCVLYALSVNAGHWSDRPRGLDLLIDARGPAVLPSFAVDMGHPGFWLADPATTVDAGRVLHAEESFTIHAPLPPRASVIGRTRIVEVVDRGAGKGALLYLEKEVKDALTGRLLARVNRTVILRSDGGFDGPSGPKRDTPAFPDTAPDIVEMVPTRPDQAFLYRLNGDPNPLHVEPEAARNAGFDRPILHGLCTFGIASTAALFALASGDTTRMRGFSARFSAPVWPGDMLRIEIWQSGAVRVHAENRGVTVLTHGQADMWPD